MSQGNCIAVVVSPAVSGVALRVDDRAFDSVRKAASEDVAELRATIADLTKLVAAQVAASATPVVGEDVAAVEAEAPKATAKSKPATKVDGVE